MTLTRKDLKLPAATPGLGTRAVSAPILLRPASIATCENARSFLLTAAFEFTRDISFAVRLFNFSAVFL